MGSTVAKQVNEQQVQLDDRQLYVPSVANTQMIANKAVMRDLLPPNESNDMNIVLGRALEHNHVQEIKNLMAIKEPKKDLIMDVFLKAHK